VQQQSRSDRLLETMWELENLVDAGDLVRLTAAG
jgi:hypothetical protein